MPAYPDTFRACLCGHFLTLSTCSFPDLGSRTDEALRTVAAEIDVLRQGKATEDILSLPVVRWDVLSVLFLQAKCGQARVG